MQKTSNLRNPFSRNSNFLEEFFCLTFVVFTFVGRWRFSRILSSDGTDGSSEISLWTIFEVRFVALVGLLVMILLIKRKYSGMNPGVRSSKTYFSNVFFISASIIIYMILTSAWTFVTPRLIYKIYELSLILVYLYVTYQICILPVAAHFLAKIWKYSVFLIYILICCAFPDLFSGRVNEDNTTGRLTVLGGGGNVFVRFVALAIIDAFYSFYRKNQLYKIALLPLLFAAMFLSGSRGGMIATFIALIIFLFFCRFYMLCNMIRFLKYLIGIIIILNVFFIVFPKLYLSLKDSIEYRIYDKTIEQRSFAGREDHYAYILSHISENAFFGHGLNGWEYYVGINNYPHNHILELYYEGGLLATLLFMILLLFILKKVLTLHSHSLLKVHIATFLIFIFFAAMCSGDFYDTRYFYSFALFAGISNSDS